MHPRRPLPLQQPAIPHSAPKEEQKPVATATGGRGDFLGLDVWQWTLAGLVFFGTFFGSVLIAQQQEEKKHAPCATAPCSSVELKVRQWDCCGHLFHDECGRWWLTTDSARRYAAKPPSVRGWHLVDSKGRHRWIGEEDCGRPQHYWRLHTDAGAAPLKDAAP